MVKARAKAPTQPDEIICKPDGRVFMRADGTAFKLRRPRVGEARKFKELIEDVVEEQKRLTALSAEELGDIDIDQELQKLLFGWWREVIEVLEEEGNKLPVEDDDWPMWFRDMGLVKEVRTHWTSAPWGPGGPPSRQQMERQAKDAAALAPLLPAAMALAQNAKNGSDSDSL